MRILFTNWLWMCAIFTRRRWRRRRRRSERSRHRASCKAEMASGRLTSRPLVEYFLARIESLDRNGPKLNSIIEINPQALEIADQLDAERQAKGARGPLHGIPVLLKDNIDTADAMHTTAGSLALVDSRPAGDAFIVARLRAAGAVILGKTNLSEWANFRSSRSSSGWSGRGGQTPQSLRPGAQPVRLELRIRRRHRGGPRGRGRGHRDRRLDRLPQCGQRHRRHQADGRHGESQRDHSDFGQPGHGGAHGANRS